MSDNGVKIHVSADADTRGIDETQRKIDALRRAAAAYESKGMDTAAASARADARALERDVARHTRERAAAERAVTREMKEQDAMQRAGIRTRGQRIGRAFQVGEQFVAGGGSPASAASSLVGMGMQTGNPIAIAATIAAALATGLAAIMAKEADKDTAQDMGVRERAFNASVRLKNQSGIFGSSSELMGSARAADEEILQRKGARILLEENAREKWHSPSTWTWGGLRKNEGQRAQELNEAEIDKREREKSVAIKAARKKYMDEEGGLELDTLRQRSQRTLAGSRAAFVNETAGKAFAKYKEVLKSGGDEDTAKEMAGLTYENEIRDRQAQAGAGLVSARSGGAEIAAAAQWAGNVTPQTQEVGAKLDTLINVVHSGNQLNQIQDQSKK